MSFILNSFLAIVGGISFAMSFICVAGFAFSLYLSCANGIKAEDVKMIRDSSAFMFIIFATVAYLTF